MNQRLLELALKRQRLQFQSAALREHWVAHTRGLQPVFQGMDRIGAGVAWMRRYPHVLIAVSVALLVARPKAVWRWARRSFVAWQFWRRGTDWLSAHRPVRTGAITAPGRRI